MTDNPVHDFLMHDRQEQEWLDSRPRCCACKEPIQEDFCLIDTNKNLYHLDGVCSDEWKDAMIPEFRCPTIG